MKKSNFFICFTGIDGAGKSTLAKFLVEHLKTKEPRTKYVYGRYVPIILKPFIILGSFLFLYKKSFFGNYSKYSESKKRASKKHPLLSKIYQTILLLDYFFQVLFKIKVPFLLGMNIVCDRYIYDTIVTDLSIDFSYSKEDIKNTLYKLDFLFPKPNTIFLIDLPEEIAFQRKDDIPSIEYLRDRREKYICLGKECNMIILDGSLKLGEIQNAIIDYAESNGIE
jgi:thymidylate kinase